MDKETDVVTFSILPKTDKMSPNALADLVAAIDRQTEQRVKEAKRQGLMDAAYLMAIILIVFRIIYYFATS